MADGISIDIKGANSLMNRLLGKAARIDKEMATGLYVSGLKVEEIAKRMLNDGPASGRVYTRKSVSHQASAPGEAPMTDTGALVNSVRTARSPNGKEVSVIAGGSAAPYAAALEFGTERVAERPFMFPALKEAKPFIRKRMKEAVKRGSK